MNKSPVKKQVLLALLCRGRRPALTILLVVMRAALAQPANNPAMKMSGVKRKGQRLNPSDPATGRNQSAIPSIAAHWQSVVSLTDNRRQFPTHGCADRGG